MTDDRDDAELLQDRISAVAEFTLVMRRALTIGSIQWVEVENDYRLLAVNNSTRRQLEVIEAAVTLAKADLGHHAVAFVRASLEDMLYLEYFLALDRQASQELFVCLGTWDAVRSVLAQHAYVGDEVMQHLWYPEGFIAAATKRRDDLKVELRALQREHGWTGGLLPSGAWIADQTDNHAVYEYLHSATSRAIHFSAGEIMRRGWGDPAGDMTTDKLEFRAHLADFALYELVVLLFETWSVVSEVEEAAGISTADEMSDEVEAAVQRIAKLGRVPLVHAREWNLTPDGPLPMPNRGGSGDRGSLA